MSSRKSTRNTRSQSRPTTLPKRRGGSKRKIISESESEDELSMRGTSPFNLTGKDNNYDQEDKQETNSNETSDIQEDEPEKQQNKNSEITPDVTWTLKQIYKYFQDAFPDIPNKDVAQMANNEKTRLSDNHKTKMAHKKQKGKQKNISSDEDEGSYFSIPLLIQKNAYKIAHLNRKNFKIWEQHLKTNLSVYPKAWEALQKGTKDKIMDAELVTIILATTKSESEDSVLHITNRSDGSIWRCHELFNSLKSNAERDAEISRSHINARIKRLRMQNLNVLCFMAELEALGVESANLGKPLSGDEKVREVQRVCDDLKDYDTELRTIATNRRGDDWETLKSALTYRQEYLQTRDEGKALPNKFQRTDSNVFCSLWEIQQQYSVRTFKQLHNLRQNWPQIFPVLVPLFQ